MAQNHLDGRPLYLWAAACILTLSAAGAEAPPDVSDQLKLLREQNAALQEQLRQQQVLIESLSRKVNRLETVSAPWTNQPPVASPEEPPATTAELSKPSHGFSLGKINISGEGGVGFFNTGSQGMFPNAEFRIDEARLFVEAPIWDSVYFYSEINLATREASDLSLKLGEIYLDVENISRLWSQDHLLSLRAGRMYIPFGEEYQYRYAIDNPLISHSISDLWGVDEGVELYGSAGKFCYVMAVQNGGISTTRDFDKDKSVAGRLSYDPAKWLHLSASAMRTGNIDVQHDVLSELWFINGWFRSLGSTNTAKFHANLVEGDVEFKLPHGHIKAFGGLAHYADDDPTADNARDVYYYSVEGVHDITRHLYVAARFGEALADKGFPMVGHGDMGTYLFGPLTKELWRLSLGVGWRFSDNFVLKTEYAFERGKQLDDTTRNHEDLFAVEAAFRF